MAVRAGFSLFVRTRFRCAKTTTQAQACGCFITGSPRGPEEVALEAASFHGLGTVGIEQDWSPEEKVNWILRYEAHRREQQTSTPEQKQAAAVERERNGHGLIYFIRSNQLVKIGKTYDLTARLAALNDPQLVVLATEPGYTLRETQLHRQFASFQYAREWFHLDGVANYIRNLPDYHGNLP